VVGARRGGSGDGALRGVPARAQLGAIVAPGPLSKAHASIEGVANCGKCHDAGQELSAAKCLKCHEPIAKRIANKTGVHRAVTDNCATCHAEHRGAGVELRRIDLRTFDHTVETGFALQGRHAPLVENCAACHKKRSFLEASTVCSACHKDTHTPSLGSDCTRCHTTRTPFKEARAEFDHTRALFTLTGAHRTVVCEKCHARGVFRGLEFSTCTPCHQEPHRHTLGPTCATCHTTERWMTRILDHNKTGFRLAGAHGRVDCAKCHPTGITKPLRSIAAARVTTTCTGRVSRKTAARVTPRPASAGRRSITPHAHRSRSWASTLA